MQLFPRGHKGEKAARIREAHGLQVRSEPGRAWSGRCSLGTARPALLALCLESQMVPSLPSIAAPCQAAGTPRGMGPMSHCCRSHCFTSWRRKSLLGRRCLDAGLLCVILFAITQPDIPRTWNRAEAVELAFPAIYLQAGDRPETSEIIKT